MALEVCLAQYFVGFGNSVSWAADEGKKGRQNVWELPCQAVMKGLFNLSLYLCNCFK